MSDSFSDSNYMKKELTNAQKTLDDSLTIAQNLLANLPPTSDLRTTSIVVGAGFELLFDLMLKFRFRTDRFAKEWMISKKNNVLKEEGIQPDVFYSDIKAIIDIRNHCGHEIEIDEQKIRGLLHGTRNYQRQIEIMSGKTLGEEFRFVSTSIMNTVRTSYSHYIANHLNNLEGWE